MGAAACACVAWAAACGACWGGALLRAAGETTAWAGAATEYTLVRVCAGAEPHLLANLMSVLGMHGPPPRRVLLVVPHGDGAAAVVRAVAAALQRRGLATTVVMTAPCGANHKAAQLACVPARELTGTVIYADGDVDLAGYPVAALLAPLGAGAAACWAPCHERAADAAWGSRASAAVLHGGLHAFALLGLIDGGACVGKLWALAPGALAMAGGWAAARDVLGEDTFVAARLRAAGHRVAMAAVAGTARPAGRSLAAAIARQARWMRVVRGQRPRLLLSYPLLFCPLLLWPPLAVAADVPAAGALAAGLAALRMALAAAARRRSSVAAAPLLTLAGESLLGDATLLAAFVVALLRRRFVWRGRALRLAPGGRLVAVTGTAGAQRAAAPRGEGDGPDVAPPAPPTASCCRQSVA